MEEHYDFSILRGPVGFTLSFVGMTVLYHVFKAWMKPDGGVEWKETDVKSDLPVSQVGKHFKKHHEQEGKQVDIEPRKDGFDATVTNQFGEDEHYEVRRSKKKKQ